MQDVNRRNINSFHRQVQLIFEQRARILFGFVLFFFAFIVKHCNGNRWVHVVLQYKSKNKSSKVVDLYQDSQSQKPRTPAWVSGVSGGKGRERCEKGRQRRERNFLSLYHPPPPPPPPPPPTPPPPPHTPLYNFLFPTPWERANTQTSDEDMPPSLVCNEN